MNRAMPPVLWGALYAMTIITLFLAYSAISNASTTTIGTIGVNVAVMAGLYHGYRWAFILALVCAAVGTTLLLAHDVALGMVALVINAMVVVPLILGRRYFFVP